MNFVKKASVAFAAISMVAAPIAASAAPVAQTLSVAKFSGARASADLNGESRLEGDSGIIIAILAAVAVIAGIVIAADGSDSTPTSP
jgi:hypothetical protein